jgi:hypothetical protein
MFNGQGQHAAASAEIEGRVASATSAADLMAPGERIEHEQHELERATTSQSRA